MKTQIITTSKDRLIGLDFFRISAAFIVFLFHSVIHIRCDYGWFQPFLRMGAIMMTGFFILSGFSMYHAYSGSDFTNIKTIADFYKKRAISILPVYYFVSVIYIYS